MGSRHLRLALPQMAVGGLSENWLFKEFGDFHWQLTADHFGVPVTELRDAQGERVLPAFVRLAMDAAQPLSAFREGDACELDGRLSRLDERTYGSELTFRSQDRTVTAQLITVFVKPSAGNVLTPVVPRVPGVRPELPADEGLLAFRREFMAARPAEPATRPDGGELFAHTYELNPYLDLNGAGLLYFASYPHINDHCERQYFHALPDAPHGDRDWTAAASTVSRDVMYLGNCGPDDAVRFRLDSCRTEADRVHLESTLLRSSDQAVLARIRTVKQLAADASPAVRRAAAPTGSRDELTRRLTPVMARALEVPEDTLAPDADLRTLGLDSFALSSFAQDATGRLGIDVDPSRLFQSFTLEDIARVVTGEPAAPREAAPRRRAPYRAASATSQPAADDEIAVVGMAGRFPGADSVGELWQLLVDGRDAIGEIPADRWSPRTSSPDGEPVRRGGFLRDIRRFDHAFFRISPREAELMDPQQRLFLEVSWEAFEDAGHDVTRLRGSRTGVFVGVCHSDYAAVLREHLTSAEPHRSVATSPSIIANRVSYAFGFHGASVAVDTLCSSSLVAVDQAVRALRDGSCEQALVGGVNVICDPGQHAAYARTGVLSADGVCRTFDAEAGGYVRGEGVCALVLKPLRQARADGDRIHAVIKSVATNHGGQAQSLTAPNPDAQADLITQAYRAAGIDPATVGYLEAHGTGTVLGDPIEVSGISAAFERLYRERGREMPTEPHIGLGSVKTAIGHLEAAAGTAGMIKVMLAMHHGELPANRNFRQLNPMIRLDGSPLRIQRERTPWTPATDAEGRPVPRRAGVSSFGMGGTNAHVVLEEFRAPEEAGGPAAGPFVVPLSARTPAALGDAARNLLALLDSGSCPPLDAVAYTLQTGRAAMAERLAIVADSPEELRSKLRGFLAGHTPLPGVWTGAAGAADPAAGSAAEERARDWAAGGEADWAALYGPGPRPRRVSLPGYPFRRDQHWIAPTTTAGAQALAAARVDGRGAEGFVAAGSATEGPGTDGSAAEGSGTGGSAAAPAVVDAFLVRGWHPSAPLAAPAPAPAPGAYLLLVNEVSAAAAAALSGQLGPDCRVIAVPAAELTARPGTLDAVLAAHGGLGPGERLAGLVDLADWWPAGQEPATAADFRGRLVLLQELLAQHRLTGPALLHLASGTAVTEAAGLYRVLSSEFRTVRSRTVQVDFGPGEADGLRSLLAAELAADDRETQVRYRAGRREHARLDFLGPDSNGPDGSGLDGSGPDGNGPGGSGRRGTDGAPSPLDDLAAGTVVITGGTGEIGLHLARELHRRGARHLLLIGRGRLPGRTRWEALAADPDTEPKLARRLAGLSELVAAGASLEVRTHALSDPASLKKLLDAARRRGGPITAVFHAAGAMDDSRSLLAKPVEDVQRVLDPKVRGLRTLWAALADQPPRLLALFSSISAGVPGLGVSYADYATANAFLDDFAAAHADRTDCAVRSVQWPVWQDTGLGRDRGGAADGLGIPALPVADALRLLDAALAIEGHPVVMACRVDRARVDTAELLRAPLPGPAAGPVAEPARPSDEPARPVAGAVSEAVTAPDATSRAAADASGAEEPAPGAVVDWLTGVFAKTLKTGPGELPATASFAELGVDSLLLAELVRDLERALGHAVDPTLLQEFPTLKELAVALAELSAEQVRAAVAEPAAGAGSGPAPEGGPVPGAGAAVLDAAHGRAGAYATATLSGTRPSAEEEARAETSARSPLADPLPQGQAAAPGGPVPIAVIGMACRFPGAEDPAAFWRNLVQGRSSITEVPPTRWDVDALYSPDGGPGKSISKWGGFIDDAADFDPGYFGFDERTADHLDPLARKALEITAECLRDAGYRDEELKRRRVGVYLGTRSANYREYLRPLPREAIVGLNQNFIAAHLSHHFDLTGPNLVVDSACSSSLVTVHLACQSLAAGESEMALAGGVDLLLDEDPYLLLSEGKALSPTGRCHTFDQAADGFVPGEGAGMVLLKRLDAAQRDGDRILAVIEASAVNNDGRTMGYTTPSVAAQRELIEEALRTGSIDPRTIGYVEAHGTGTMIGDPIELQALTAVFRKHTADKEFCAVGSVKTNVGHLLSAAGVAGLIKTALCLRHQQVPPTLNCVNPNPRFAFAESPFYPATEVRDFSGGAGLERAAVSAFGFGGTNAHLIMRRAAEADGHRAGRQPLPAPDYDRKRIWPRRAATTPPTLPKKRSARLDLTFLSTG